MKKENEEIIEKILKERIKENEKMFTDKELQIINNNVNIIKKIYLLVFMDIKQTYGKKLQ